MKTKRLKISEIEDRFTPEYVLKVLHIGFSVSEIADMMTRSYSNTYRYIRDICKIKIPMKARTDAYALMCYEYGLNAAEFLRARGDSEESIMVTPVRYKMLNGKELVFQPGRVRSTRYFLSNDFLDRTLPFGFSFTLFQRICIGYTHKQAYDFHVDKGYIDWLIGNNDKPMHHIYNLVAGMIPKEWG